MSPPPTSQPCPDFLCLFLSFPPLLPPPLQVCGVNQVIKIYMPPDERQIWDPTHGLVSLKGTGRRTLLADGANLMEIMACPDVDHTKTVCNDVMEVRGVRRKRRQHQAGSCRQWGHVSVGAGGC